MSLHAAVSQKSEPLNNIFLDKLFSVVLAVENGFLIKLADETHPVFAAHFESNPILPGFLHIEIIASLFCIEVAEVKKAKYLEIARPNETLKIAISKKDGLLMGFEVTKDGGAAASKIELSAKADIEH